MCEFMHVAMSLSSHHVYGWLAGEGLVSGLAVSLLLPRLAMVCSQAYGK